jgi:hypothetical protein
MTMPLASSFAFAVGVQTSISAGDMPPVVQRAEALPGAITATARRAAINANPAFNLNMRSKPISFVGLRG